MAFVPAPGVCQVDLIQSQGGAPIVNSIYIRKTTAWTETDQGLLRAAIQTWWVNTHRANLSNDIALTAIRTRDLSVQDGVTVTQQLATPSPGTRPVDAAPNNVALVTSLRTGLAGRSRRGRLYLAGIGEDEVGQVIIDPARTAAIGSSMTALATTISAQGWDWVVISRFLNGVARVTALVTQILTIITNSGLDSQRRRLT